MRLAEATASWILFLWTETLLVAARVSSTPRSLTWTATWAPKASATCRKAALAPAPEARITDLVRLTTMPVALSSSEATTKAPTRSVAAFLRGALGEKPPIIGVRAELRTLSSVRGAPHGPKQEKVEHTVGEWASRRYTMGRVDWSG